MKSYGMTPFLPIDSPIFSLFRLNIFSIWFENLKYLVKFHGNCNFKQMVFLYFCCANLAQPINTIYLPKNILSWKILQVRKPFYITLQLDVFENWNADDKQNFTKKHVKSVPLKTIQIWVNWPKFWKIFIAKNKKHQNLH
jgi:hypothetical protein